MPYNGNGVFNRLYNWENDAAAGIDIMADRMDAEFNGIAVALSTALTRDGQAGMSAELDMANFKIIRLAEPELDTDAATKGYVKNNVSWTIDEFDQVTFNFLTTFAANAVIRNNQPTLTFIEEDQVDPAGRYRFIGLSDNFQLQRAATENFATQEVIYSATGGATPKQFIVGSLYQFQINSGVQIISGAAPVLRFLESDQVDPAGRYTIRVQSNLFQVVNHTAVDFGGIEPAFQINGTVKAVSVLSPYVFQGQNGQYSFAEDANTALRFKQSSAATGVGVLQRVDATNFYFMLTDSGDANGTFNALRPFAINKTTGLVTIGNGLSIAPNTNGGILFGTSLPTLPSDTSKHITLHQNGYGFSVTSGTLNMVTSAAGVVDFIHGTSLGLRVSENNIAFETFGSGNTTGATYSSTSVSLSAASTLSSSAAFIQCFFGTTRTFLLRRDGLTDFNGQYAINANNGWTNSGVYISAKTGQAFYCASGLAANAMFQIRDVDNAIVARVDLDDTAQPAVQTIQTRRKADARYTLQSSQRFKENIVDAAQDMLVTAFDAFRLRGWIWGGEMDPTDERHGLPGFGLVVEELEADFPAAVRYIRDQEVPPADPQAPGALPTLLPDLRPHALNADAVFAALIAKIRSLEARLEAAGI